MIQNKIEKAIRCVDVNANNGQIKFEEIVIINSTDFNRDGIVASLLSNKKYTPAKGDKIYFEPGCTVPRFKVKQMCQKYGVAVVKAPGPNSIRILSPDTINKLITGIYGECYDKDVILPVLRKVGRKNFEPLIKAIYDNPCQYVFVDYKASRYFDNHITEEYDSVDYELKPDYKFIDDEAYKLYQELNNNPNVYSQNEILSKLNDGAVMDDEKYESIKRLFESTSQDDHKVALEIMANCDYEKSCVYLLLLFKNYGHVIDDCPNKRHVNFKSLVKFFEINRIDRVNLNDIIDSLITRKLLNRSNLDKLMPQIMEEMKDSSPVERFNIKEIEYDDEITKALEETILDFDKDTDIVNDDEEEINPKL